MSSQRHSKSFAATATKEKNATEEFALTNAKPLSFTAENAEKCFTRLKTQTRRLVRLPCEQSEVTRIRAHHAREGWFVVESEPLGRCFDIKPYLLTGQVFYIREPWRTVAEADRVKPTGLANASWIHYDGTGIRPDGFGKCRPAMFLQRRFARPARYQITAVRCERVNSISEEDAKAEGIKWQQDLVGTCGQTVGKIGSYVVHLRYSSIGMPSAWMAFEKLWNSIHGNQPGRRFEDAPWVYVYCFQQVI